ncbi:MAG: N-acetyltransferase [Mycoplasmataceae bacterium]|jgi:predicted GNAT family acetyltransferase|nr:N-acetyltransferase [Mycoplasmataceae bacterium]
MEKYLVEKKNSNMYQLTLKQYPTSFLMMQLLDQQLYCVISTHVDFDQRGKGIGTHLYKAMLDFIRKEKAKFNATCPFIVKLADLDQTIKDIYQPRY